MRYAKVRRSLDKDMRMNNEPVAWARQDGVIAFHKKPEVDSQGFKWFPLYTHPVKELTDEDLEAVYQTMTGIEVNHYEYARACIRKAQEK